MTAVSDYTGVNNTFQRGYTQQHRILGYIQDCIKNFFSDPINIKNPVIAAMLFDPRTGAFIDQRLKIDRPYDQRGVYTGSTPCMLVSLGPVTYKKEGLSVSGNPAFVTNKMQAPAAQQRHKDILLNVTVVTQSYDGTVQLTELLQAFLVMNQTNFVRDCAHISGFRVQGLSAPQAIPASGSSGNPRQVYQCNISIATTGFMAWTQDTQGPVFRGINVELQ